MLFLFLWVGSLFLLPYLIRQKFEPVYRLYTRFQLPLMLLAIFFGIIVLVQNPHKLRSGPFHMKLTAVLGLIACDVYSGRLAYLFSRFGTLKRRSVYFFLQGAVLFCLLAIISAILLGKNG